MSYSDDILEPGSKKHVFASEVDQKLFFGWIDNSDSTFYQASTERVVRVVEKILGGEFVNIGDAVASQAALVAVSTASEGAWFFDFALMRLWYKPKASSASPHENKVVAGIEFRFSNFGDDNLEGLPTEPTLIGWPTLKSESGARFDKTHGTRGSGSVRIVNQEQRLARLDYEPDGRIDFTERIDIMGAA